MRGRTQIELWIKMALNFVAAYLIFRNFITMFAIIWLKYIIYILP